jgi:putative membrane-bound dehydrogenase-like protein
VELVAAEPDVRAPVALAWDADDRMFVAEMTDYPSGPVSGRIRLLEDRDGDGRCESSRIFAADLAFPNGLMAWREGVLVTAAPDIWYLADTNKDGVADVREKILTGFAEGNQQLRVNGLYWGIDNWIYGANGRSDGEVKWADGTPAGSIRRKDFRFRPDTKQFEAIAGNSQFGMGHDDWGNRFPVFNATPIRHVVMEERYLARQPLLAAVDNVPNISPSDDGTRVFALTPPTLLIPQPIGHFTSACGPSIYRGTALPSEYRGNYFVCEPVQNVVQRRVLVPNGSTFVAEYAHTNAEFLASTDRWFHGVFTATGPDGALYVVDFYRDLVEHPHWVAPELRDKVDWRKGEEHGRIWRVRAKDANQMPAPRLSSASQDELLRMLESGNGWTRDTAHRLLFERNATNAIALLASKARRSPAAQTRVHALNLLAALCSSNSVAFAESVLNSLSDTNARVREHAVQLAERCLLTHEKLRESLLRLAKDPDARVRLQLACSIAVLSDGQPSDKERKMSVLTKLAQNEGLDEWQSLAILGSTGERSRPLLKRLAPAMQSPSEAQLQLLERAARIIAAGSNVEDKRSLLGWLSGWNSPARVAAAAAFMDSSKADLQNLDLDGKKLPALTQAARDLLQDRSAPERLRIAAIRMLPPADSARVVGTDEPESLQVAAIRAVMESGDEPTIRAVFERAPALPRVVRRQAVSSSIRSRVAALELERAISNEKLALTEIDPVTRQALEKFSDAEVKARANKLFANAISPDRDVVVQKYRSALKMSADQKRGAGVFERNCTVCHQMQGVGAKIGPDLSGIGQQPRETLLVQILDPSRQVLPDFVAYSAETKNGESYVGFIAKESPETVTLRRANESDLTLKRSELKALTSQGKSLMPDGLESAMTEQDVADLIEFLRRPDRTLFTQHK